MDYRLRYNNRTTDLRTAVGVQTKGKQSDYRLRENRWTTDLGTAV